MQINAVQGFSKKTKKEKIDWLLSFFSTEDRAKFEAVIRQYWNQDSQLQRLHDEFSENTVSNFYLPYGIAPNFLINGELKALPMATEESSVVAAASKAAKFWQDKGGFSYEILGQTKLGHTHFMFHGDFQKLNSFFSSHLRNVFFAQTEDITKNMRARGGGISDIELIDKTDSLEGYYQIKVSFDTVDSMGANFINSCLEKIGQVLFEQIQQSDVFEPSEKESVQIVMNILSNYTPDCLVRASVGCPVDHLVDDSGISPQEFAQKLQQAVRIASVDVSRATTHNKGIMNGVDAFVIATGNDFRAVEASAHAYAARDGQYRSLSNCSIENGEFRFWMDLPISLGVVGGLTSLHPLVKFSLGLLQNPSAKELMGMACVSGLAQNFAALRSLVTTGIQKGHMKMHLQNILNQLGATTQQKQYLTEFFQNKTVSHHQVIQEFHKLQNS